MTALAEKLPDWPLPALMRDHWRASLLVAAMLVLWVFAGANLAMNGSGRGFDTPAERAAVPRTEAARLRQQAAQMGALQLKQIAPQDALALNAAVPISNSANPAARPFTLLGNAADRARSLECLTAAIYYEAATEPTDGSLRRAPMAAYWERAKRVAEAALNGYVYAPVGWSTHYHANYVVPYWSSSLVKAANVGTHIFYRWRGGWGRAPAFLSRYAGVEPVIAWRGGFGQPTAAERLAAAQAGERDAAAAEAALEAAPIGSVDSFQRAVLRRYEPLRRDTANEVIAERAGASRVLSRSERWSLTGDSSNAPAQRPLGRWGTEPNPSPATAAPPTAARTAEPAPRPPALQADQPPANGGGESTTAAR